MRYAIYATLILTLSLTCGCERAQAPSRIQWLSMGTAAAVMAPGGQGAQLMRWREVTGQAFDEIEDSLSIFRSNSVITAINDTAGSGQPLTVTGSAAACIAQARSWAEASQGAFDPTVGPLMDMWGFRKKKVAAVPDAATIAATKERTGWQNVVMRTNTAGQATVFLAKHGMRLDLGGIAKGYAVDLAYDRLRAADSPAFMIDLGGNIRVHGAARSTGTGWRVGIRDPFDTSRILGTVVLANGQAIATSGNYEQFVDIEGTRYTHIIDPRNGWPVSGIAGVTVIAPTAAQADALSTALFVMGVDDGLALLKRLSGCHALWIPASQPPRLICTKGFRQTLAAEFIANLTIDEP